MHTSPLSGQFPSLQVFTCSVLLSSGDQAYRHSAHVRGNSGAGHDNLEIVQGPVWKVLSNATAIVLISIIVRSIPHIPSEDPGQRAAAMVLWWSPGNGEGGAAPRSFDDLICSHAHNQHHQHHLKVQLTSSMMSLSLFSSRWSGCPGPSICKTAPVHGTDGSRSSSESPRRANLSFMMELDRARCGAKVCSWGGKSCLVKVFPPLVGDEDGVVGQSHCWRTIVQVNWCVGVNTGGTVTNWTQWAQYLKSRLFKCLLCQNMCGVKASLKIFLRFPENMSGQVLWFGHF